MRNVTSHSDWNRSGCVENWEHRTITNLCFSYSDLTRKFNRSILVLYSKCKVNRLLKPKQTNNKFGHDGRSYSKIINLTLPTKSKKVKFILKIDIL